MKVPFWHTNENAKRLQKIPKPSFRFILAPDPNGKRAPSAPVIIISNPPDKFNFGPPPKPLFIHFQARFCYNSLVIFANSGMLFLLVLILPLLAMLMLYNFRKKRRIIRAYLSDEACRKNVVRSGSEIDFFKSLLLILAVMFLILALARPQWGERYESLDIRGIELTFLLDTSDSMNAEDLKPNRLETAKNLITTIVDNLKTDMVSLINFAAVAYVQCPLTIDYEAFKLLTQASPVSPQEEQGTDFEKPFVLALRVIEKSKSSRKILILITDGEDLENRWADSLQRMIKKQVTVFSVGVGASDGAPIPIKNKEERIIDWKKTKEGTLVKSKLDENTLIRITSSTGGQYFRLTDPSGIDSFLGILASFERKRLAEKIRTQKIERFHYPLGAAILLLLCEMVLSERTLRWKRK
jgi:Ca-activated chloride channel family protein